MEYLVVVTGYLKQPLAIPQKENKTAKMLSEIHNNFIFECETPEKLYLATAGQVQGIIKQGGMFGRKNPDDVVANHDVDMRTRIFVPIENITYLDFNFNAIMAAPIDDTGEKKELIN